MATWVRQKGKASENRQRKRYAKEADKVEVVPEVNVGSLRRFRATSIEPMQGLPKRRRLRSLRTLRELCGRCYALNAR